MIANLKTYTERLGRIALTACMLALVFAATPALAQEEGASDEQVEQLKVAFSEGVQAAKAENYETALEKFNEAKNLAESAEQQGALNKINQYIEAASQKWATQALKSGDYAAAIERYDSSIEQSPNNATLYFNKGMAQLKADQTEEGLQTLQKAIEVGNEANNRKVVQSAEERIRSEFVSRASQALNAQDPTEAQARAALEALDQLEQYNVQPDADAYFYRAAALYELGESDQAIQMARQGLDQHRGGRTSEAKFHFVIGEALLQQGNTAEAKQAFTEAAYGDYKPRAEHYLETL